MADQDDHPYQVRWAEHTSYGYYADLPQAAEVREIVSSLTHTDASLLRDGRKHTMTVIVYPEGDVEVKLDSTAAGKERTDG